MTGREKKKGKKNPGVPAELESDVASISLRFAESSWEESRRTAPPRSPATAIGFRKSHGALRLPRLGVFRLLLFLPPAPFFFCLERDLHKVPATCVCVGSGCFLPHAERTSGAAERATPLVFRSLFFPRSSSSCQQIRRNRKSQSSPFEMLNV